jgi:hypothetical protein
LNYHLTDLRRNEIVLKLARNANTDGIVNCLLQPGQLRNQLHKSMLVISFHLLYLYTLTYPAAETKSVGLQIDAQLAAFFALRI